MASGHMWVPVGKRLTHFHLSLALSHCVGCPALPFCPRYSLLSSQVKAHLPYKSSSHQPHPKGNSFLWALGSMTLTRPPIGSEMSRGKLL